MSEPTISASAVGVLTSGLVVAAPQVMVFGIVPAAVLYAAAFGAALWTLKSRPGDLRENLVSWALGLGFGVASTLIVIGLAGAVEALKPALAVPPPAFAVVFGFLGVTISERVTKYAQSAKIPGDKA